MPIQGSGADPARAALEAENRGLRARLDAAERRCRQLENELRHRVRGVLAVINAVARRTAETSFSPEDYVLHLDGRIGAIGRAQGAGVRDPQGGVALDRMIADELLAHAAQEGEQLSLSGPPVRVSGKAVETVWLAMHELAVNAVKYGALSAAGGRIAISWRLDTEGGPPGLALEWREQGGPAPDAAPRRRTGFGTEVIERTLACELGAKAALSFEPMGMLCRIEMPLSAQVAPAEAAA